MLKIKWLWWRFWAWLTKPWTPEDKLGNPRSRKRRGDPAWMIFCTQLMRAVNCMMGAVIIVMLLMLAALNMGPQ